MVNKPNIKHLSSVPRQLNCLGIIKAKDDHDNIYWYIGQCSGTDEATDIKFILQYGVKYSQDQIEYLKGLFS